MLYILYQMWPRDKTAGHLRANNSPILINTPSFFGHTPLNVTFLLITDFIRTIIFSLFGRHGRFHIKAYIIIKRILVQINVLLFGMLTEPFPHLHAQLYLLCICDFSDIDTWLVHLQRCLWLLVLFIFYNALAETWGLLKRPAYIIDDVLHAAVYCLLKAFFECYTVHLIGPLNGAIQSSTQSKIIYT